jgi:hypothetical protein
MPELHGHRLLDRRSCRAYRRVICSKVIYKLLSIQW